MTIAASGQGRWKEELDFPADCKASGYVPVLVVLDREAGFIHQLNKTATYIWEQCDGERTAAAIADRVCDVFEVDESTALSDVLEILRRLQDLNLLENTEDANKNRKGVSYHV